MSMKPFFVFNGNCKEALDLYAKAFNGKVTMVNKFGNMPPNPQFEMKDEWKELIMHARLQLEDGTEAMFADTLPTTPIKEGSSIKIFIPFNDEQKAKAAYEILKEGAEIKLELQKTFFSPCHAELVDKFGTHWVLSTVNPNMK